MDRYWLITWTAYGNWLPGDPRGFVGNVCELGGTQANHNVPGTPYDADLPALTKYVREHMKGPPVTLDEFDADALIGQYQETASIRKWMLCAASVMYNHTHVVIGVESDPDPESLLETLKSWATRRLKRHRVLPPNGTFWTEKGSKRKLPDQQALCDGVIYVVRKQPNPLAIWFAPEFQEIIDNYDTKQASRAP
jgi:REP element-mobilizing transposase RayT